MERRIEPLAGQETSLDQVGVIRKDVSALRSGAACMEIVRIDDLCIRHSSDHQYQSLYEAFASCGLGHSPGSKIAVGLPRIPFFIAKPAHGLTS
jgi:hypothetical protein